MKQFFKFVAASMLGFLISIFVIFIFFVIGISAMIAAAGNEAPADVSNNSVLRIDLNYPINERTISSPLEGLNIPGFKSTKSLGLNDILASIKKARTDDNIKGICLDLSGIQAGMATIEEIRNALIDFKTSHKFIYSYSEVYTKGDYYLASVADKVYINPEGFLEFSGFNSDITFFKGALDKLGIEAQIIKVGTYKSAVEPFILDHMSDANRLQVTSFLGSMYDHYLLSIAASRKIPKDSLFAIANELKVRTAVDAVKYRLADGVRYKDQLLDELKAATGIDKKKNVNSISIEDYSGNAGKTTAVTGDRVAVVYAVGEIAGGEGSDEVMGSEKISRDLRKVRLDDHVKAVVLRVNSPGGGVLASDVIWREVVLTRKVKPVVVSMGDVAASGGYYIACGADSIFAQPNTITGSIGVFGIIPNMKEFFNNKLGITFDGVKTGQYADMGSIDRPLTPAERLIFQREVNRVYDGFTKRVAEGRKKSQAYVDSIGQGRVWSGTEALKIGLVDKLGSINDAIRSAAGMAKLKDYKLVNYPVMKDPFQSLFDNSGERMKDYVTRMQLGEEYTYYKQLKSAVRLTGVQARMPFTISVK
ncbi:signal peptide peptidase SppA [Hufsiella ginkgonis]|uniref:Signal peptide peptidase SppA n=1 Tax=Hufsiella ginkgonis TaxID=2695274 RepID=A0A7K1XXY3_9SPHI|nr:signal peptide peptidase SppA [Hufsiella ginkgonis]MXV15386.1 signal peptide peptidase SppA [Hufsiella ginkgonis]